MRRGDGCPMCAEGRPDETPGGIRFFEGRVTDAYLRTTAIQRAVSVVIWRRRHVAEPTELDVDDATAYWAELLIAARAIEEVFEPVKLNYDTLGNSVPHLHTHVVPRFADDPKPGWPFPFPDPEPGPWPEATLSKDLSRLRAAILDSAMPGTPRRPAPSAPTDRT